MAYKHRQASWLWKVLILCTIVSTVIIVWNLISALGDDNQGLITYYAIFTPTYIMFMLALTISYVYLEIKDEDGMYLNVGYGPLKIWCCCNNLRIPYNIIDSYRFSEDSNSCNRGCRFDGETCSYDTSGCRNMSCCKECHYYSVIIIKFRIGASVGKCKATQVIISTDDPDNLLTLLKSKVGKGETVIKTTNHNQDEMEQTQMI